MQGNIQDELLFPHPQKHNLADFYPSSVPPKCFLVCKHPNIKKNVTVTTDPRTASSHCSSNLSQRDKCPLNQNYGRGAKQSLRKYLSATAGDCASVITPNTLCPTSSLFRRKNVKKKTWRRLCRCASITKFALSKMGRTEMSKNAFHRPQHYRHQNLAQKSLKLDQMLKKT